MKTSSAKAKGRRLQQKVAERIREYYGLPDSDVRSLPMGAPGADVWLSEYARKKFPFAIECKNVESINIWKAYAQAKTHADDEPVLPLVVFSRNNSETLVTLALEDLFTFGFMKSCV